MQIQRQTNFTDQDKVEVHDDELNLIMQEMNQQDSALADVNQALKKSATTILTVVAADYTTSTGFFNRVASKSFTHGLPYVPISFGYIAIGGNTYQAPYQDFDATTGVYRGTIDVTSGVGSVLVVANYNNVTPDFTAYVFVSTATGDVANA